jgi:hypothetical protein
LLIILTIITEEVNVYRVVCQVG